MEVKRKMIFTLALIAIFSISSVWSGHGHSSHGHSSHGHSSHGHSSSGHSSYGHSSHTEGHSGSHVESSGQSHHNSETHLGSYDHHSSDTDVESHYHPNSNINRESQYHHNSDSVHNGNGNSDVYGHDYNPTGYHHDYYPNHHHNHQDNFAHNAASSTTTTPAPIIEEAWLEVSCDKGLSNYTGNNYPREKIAAAVRELRKALSSNNRNSDSRFSVKREVSQYLFMLNMPSFESIYTAAATTTGCEEVKSSIAPLGGCDINYTGFIIVNVPDLAQVIKTVDCRSTFTFCNYAEGSICLQSKKQQKLLVLPAKQGPFDVSDFSVATFKFHDGCDCVSGDQKNAMDYFINF